MGLTMYSEYKARSYCFRALAIVIFCILFYYIIFDSAWIVKDDAYYSAIYVATHLPSESDAAQPTPSLPLQPSPERHNPYTELATIANEHELARTLVIAKTSTQDTAWIEEELADLLHSNSSLASAIYIADDRNAPLHPPVNKGHEAMIYLTYIIDHYDKLPNVAIFMHFHQGSWHNNDLLDGSAAKIVRHLSSEKIFRDGYMNLRCHWEPGCPSWIRPKQLEFADDHKKEELQFAQAFTELFPNDPVPDVLAQPCCAQFAVSGERIRRHSRQRYIDMRTWLQNTDLDDYTSGRVFEYSWQFIFTSEPIHCRNMHICYCDGYSICFEDEHSYVQYTDIQDVWRAYQDDLQMWKQHMAAYVAGEGDAPEEGRDAWLQRNIEDLALEMGRRKQGAEEIGKDRTRKYDVLARAWDQLNDHPPGHLAEKYGHFGVDSTISPI